MKGQNQQQQQQGKDTEEEADVVEALLHALLLCQVSANADMRVVAGAQVTSHHYNTSTTSTTTSADSTTNSGMKAVSVVVSSEAPDVSHGARTILGSCTQDQNKG